MSKWREREESKRLMRRLSLWTYGFVAAAILLAIIGGALVAWVLTGAGYPFLRTWLLLAVLLLAIPGLVHLAPWPRT